MHVHSSRLSLCFRRRDRKLDPNSDDSTQAKPIDRANGSLTRPLLIFRKLKWRDNTSQSKQEPRPAGPSEESEREHERPQSQQHSGAGITRVGPSLLNRHTPIPVLDGAVGQLRRTESEQQHVDYLETLEVPTLEQISNIAQVQEAREKAITEKYANRENCKEHPEPGADDQLHDARERSSEGGTERSESRNRLRENAAGTIQRTYRGHRERRQMAGLTLDPTTRWVEALKSARYQNVTDPKRRKAAAAASRSLEADRDGDPKADSQASTQARRKIDARNNWHHVSNIASHAMGDLPKDTLDDGQPKISHPSDQTATETQEAAYRPEDDESGGDGIHGLRKSRKKKKAWAGKMMDLPYFLEMVDVKHRYGSNLRAYHAEWRKRNTHENFFYWLDYGEGKDVEIETVSRQRLEKEQVRYLSREERLQYLVRIDDQGRLVWAKNGERITTSTDYRDSLEGIVPTESKVKMFREDEIKAIEGQNGSSSSFSSSSSGNDGDASSSSNGDHSDHADQDNSDAYSISTLSSATASPMSELDVSDASRRYPDPVHAEDGSRKPARQAIKSISAHAILNRLMRKTLSKNTWIFVADTSMNMYVGIKQSGAFQHSSFMKGSRISAAGTIKIKDGQLRALNPLSGHYRTPKAAFQHFVRSLKSSNADMSRVSISKSYVVLVGLETYLSGRRKAKKAEAKAKKGAGMLVHPSRARAEKEKEKDHSKSAEIERARLRQEKGTLGRVLEDARERVEERWTAIREPEMVIQEPNPASKLEERASNDLSEETDSRKQCSESGLQHDLPVESATREKP